MKSKNVNVSYDSLLSEDIVLVNILERVASFISDTVFTYIDNGNTNSFMSYPYFLTCLPVYKSYIYS